MSPQHDYVIDNSTGANVRSDINSALQAIASNNSGSSAPSTTYAFQLFADTTNNVMKIRNSANNVFIELFQLDGTLTLEDGSASTPALAFRDDLNTGIFSSAANTFDIATGGVSRLQIDTSEITFNESGEDTNFRIEGDTDQNLFFVDAGNDRVAIGLNTPSTPLHIKSADNTLATFESTDADSLIEFKDNGTSDSILMGALGGDDLLLRCDAGNIVFRVLNNSEMVRIAADGNVGIATSSPSERLHVNNTALVNALKINDSGAFHNSGKFQLKGHSTGSHTAMRVTDSSGSQIMILRCDGHFEVSGSLAKGSGSFKIDHPLPSLADTKTLRHSFIEGPQCDNIYRGKIVLSSGTATINLDLVSKMTEGTFVALNRDIQCFTTNETGFSNVKGSVSENILTITSEDSSSTDTISWLVVGERQDPNIKESSITDDEGYLIVEETKVAA
tara:strand:- start:77 stop:1417 length:1341 start_codon:yes stop_codon:yes gene_type:complete